MNGGRFAKVFVQEDGLWYNFIFRFQMTGLLLEYWFVWIQYIDVSTALNRKFDCLSSELRNLVLTRQRLLCNRKVAIIQVIRSWHGAWFILHKLFNCARKQFGVNPIILLLVLLHYLTAAGKQIRVTAQQNVLLNVMALGRNSWSGIGKSVLFVGP